MSDPRFYLELSNEVVPFFNVPKAKGDGMRKATIVDAVKAGAVPSVTTILKVLAKPQLDKWLRRKTAEAALTLPRLPNETDEAFLDRITDDADEEGKAAGDLGSEIHQNISDWLTNNKTPVHPLNVECIAWLSDNLVKLHHTERNVIHRVEKYGGRLDLYAELKGLGNCVVDFKSQNIRNGKPTFYPEWGMQLAAYGHAVVSDRYDEGMPKLVSIVIDSSKPGPIFCEQWDNPMIQLTQFHHALELWKHLNKWNER